MTAEFTRRGFIGAAAAVSAAGFTASASGTQDQPEEYGEAGEGGLGPSYPTTAPSQAQAIVGASHVNAERVEELLRQDRSLALAVWDWGFGDWESALGAASHMGNREIAGLLIAEGARPDLFTLAMMDNVDAVRAICEAMPGVQERLGPHGISMMSHARHGKAERVQEYLESIGGADGAEPGEAKDDDGLDVFVGEFTVGGERLVTSRHSRGWLGIEREGGSFRTLRRLDELEFSPGGAPHVRVVFERARGRVSGLSISQGGQTVVATRSDG